MNTSSSIFVLIYAPGMSNTATSRSAYILITADIITASVETGDDVASVLFYFLRCLRLSVHPRALIVPSRFSLMNNSISNTSFFLSSVISSDLRGPNNSRMCSCSKSLVTYAHPSRLYLRYTPLRSLNTRPFCCFSFMDMSITGWVTCGVGGSSVN